jgi:putative PIN family toxin of toxin-antitoxin system
MKIVLDANIFVSQAIYGKMGALLERAIKYNFVYVVNNHLLNEVHKTLLKPALSKYFTMPIEEVLDIISLMTMNYVSDYRFQLSPDPNDNFLFDLALKTRSYFIITAEKSLLTMINPHVKVYDMAWFKSNFPI